jgi:hypothetical protein
VRICRDEWGETSYPITLKAVIAAKGAFNKVMSKMSEYLCKCYFSVILFNKLAKKKFFSVFALSFWGIVCRVMRGKTM